MPFRKGQSGNPGGRKPMPMDVVALCRAVTAEAVQKQIEIMRIETDDPSMIAVQARVMDSLLNRGWGIAPQTVVLQGDTTIRIITPGTRGK
jgi:hypothetical protein